MELRLLIEAGLMSTHVIVAETRNSGLALEPRIDGLETLEEGKFADLLLVDGDMLKDIHVLQKLERIKLVMKGGEVVVRKA